MSNGYDALVSSLETRFDYQSARTVAKEAVAAAGLKEQAKYSPAELQSVVDALGAVGTDMDRVWSAVGVSPSGAPAPAAPAAPAKAEKPAKEAKAEDEAKAEEAPAEKPAAKPAAKKKAAAKKKPAAKKKK